MKERYLKRIILFLVLIGSINASAQEITDFFQKSDTFFKTHIVNGKVNYKTIKLNPKPLNELMAIAKTIEISIVNKNQYTAFWINAYNLAVIKTVVDNYPVESPLDISGFFDKQMHLIAGVSTTLNNIENKLLRGQLNNDPRLHFVLVCAGLGCPPIIAVAYLPKTVEVQLNTQTKLALNNNDFIKVNTKKKKVEFSQIFEWYKSDFIANSKSLIEFVNHYRKSPISESFKTSYYSYDWTLNNHQ